MQAWAESLKASPGSTDGMQDLIALLGTADWALGSGSANGSAEAELAKAFASISGPPALITADAGMKSQGLTNAEPALQADASNIIHEPAAEAEIKAEGGPAQERAELMQGLTDEIAAAAQKAAQDAISSSVQVSSSSLCLLLIH